MSALKDGGVDSAFVHLSLFMKGIVSLQSWLTLSDFFFFILFVFLFFFYFFIIYILFIHLYIIRHDFFCLFFSSCLFLILITGQSL